MIRFISVQTKPYQGQNNLDILVDNQICQQYFNGDQNLIIEAEFGNTLIQEINLHLYPEPEKDILYKCYNLNELDQEYRRISGKLIKIRNEENYITYAAFVKSEVPFTRLTITIQSEKSDSFKIYYFGVRGKNIEEESQQQESVEQKNIKVILKPGRKTETFNNRIVDNDKMTPSEFFSRVKSGIPISNREQQPQKIIYQNYDEKMKIEQAQINAQNLKFTDKIQEESKVKEDPDSKKYITLYDDDENSVQFIDQKVKQQQQQQQQQQNNKNHFNSQKCCFSDTKPISSDKMRTKQLNITNFTYSSKQTVNQDIKVEYNVFHNMMKYTASEIDQEFLQFHKTIEESKNVPAKYRLIHRLNTQQY